MSRAVVAAALLLVAAVPAYAAGDATAGKAVFQRCALCHSLAPGANGMGPSLHGIVGSKAGTVPGYSFSAAMAKSGIVWDDAALNKFLADPAGTIPGTKMHAGAVDDAQARADLIAFLHQAAK